MIIEKLLFKLKNKASKAGTCVGQTKALALT